MHSCQERELAYPLAVLRRPVPGVEHSVTDKSKRTERWTHSLTLGLVLTISFPASSAQAPSVPASLPRKESKNTYAIGIFLSPSSSSPPFVSLVPKCEGGAWRVRTTHWRLCFLTWEGLTGAFPENQLCDLGRSLSLVEPHFPHL